MNESSKNGMLAKRREIISHHVHLQLTLINVIFPLEKENYAPY